MRYAIWNNKGGVGKSFLTFILASEYAARYPNETIFVVDMCPQANVSEIILGGNGKGTQVLADLLKEPDRRTIGGYFDSRIAQPHVITGNETGFSVRPSDFNQKIPKNLFLVVGDPSLEVQAEAINQIANQSLPPQSWRNAHSWLNDLCAALDKTFHKTTFFIDCNPSFAAYTELSIVAADKLIVPCSADGSSARAINNIAQLVYGHGVPPQYEGAMFASRLKNERISPPSIGFVILNRSTQYNQKASQAFGAMFQAIRKRTENLLNSEPQARGNEEDCFFDIPDTHSVAIVASHLGLPIRDIEVRKYQVYDKEPQVNSGPLERYTSAIEAVVDKL